MNLLVTLPTDDINSMVSVIKQNPELIEPSSYLDNCFNLRASVRSDYRLVKSRQHGISSIYRYIVDVLAKELSAFTSANRTALEVVDVFITEVGFNIVYGRRNHV